MKLVDEDVVPEVVFIYVVLKFQILLLNSFFRLLLILLGCNEYNKEACCCQSLIAAGGCSLHVECSF